MNRFALILILIVFSVACSRPAKENTKEQSSFDPVDAVNPLMGTDSKFRLSNGNTYPAIARPWGMNFWTPQTAKMGDGWMYAHDADQIVGFRQTHQPSPWINDYGAFSLMPLTGKLKVDEKERASWFSHKAETVKPYYYKVYLADYDVTTELTPTERAVQFLFTFPETDSAFILIDGFFKGSMVKIIPEENKVVGYCRNNSGGVPANFHNYFVAIFDQPFNNFGTWNELKIDTENQQAEGEHVGAYLHFNTAKGEEIKVKVASSFISLEQAELNLQREIGKDDFNTTLAQGREIWNNELSKILVEGGTEDQRKTFYSCLYRTLLFPRKFHELDANDQVVHYSPYNGTVQPGYMFTDNGFWDTFRSVFPFFTLMDPELDGQIIQFSLPDCRCIPQGHPRL